MTPLKVTLPAVTASGKREGWWYHVTGLAHGKRHPGEASFGDFEGTRLVAGECELPPLAVVLLARPIGTARLDERVNDVMYVSPASGQLVGLGYGYTWEDNSQELLRLAVHDALQAQAKWEATERKLSKILTGWTGKGNTEANRSSISKELADIVKDVIPAATDLTVGPAEGFPDALSVRFTVSAVEGGVA